MKKVDLLLTIIYSIIIIGVTLTTFIAGITQSNPVLVSMSLLYLILLCDTIKDYIKKY